MHGFFSKNLQKIVLSILQVAFIKPLHDNFSTAKVGSYGPTSLIIDHVKCAVHPEQFAVQSNKCSIIQLIDFYIISAPKSKQSHIRHMSRLGKSVILFNMLLGKLTDLNVDECLYIFLVL